MPSLLVLSLSLLLFISCKESQETPENLTALPSSDSDKTFQNPIFDKNFPDPTVIEAADGNYFIYGTNSNVDGTTVNLQVMKSADLVNWEYLGEGLPTKPSWAKSDFWAPHVYYDGESKKYYLYYSGESVDENQGKCMGVAVSDSPEGPFIDKGSPLLCGQGFINIDPMLLDDPKSGKKYLYWGSGHEAIKAQEMADNLLDFKEGTQDIELIFPIENDQEDNYSRLVEGAWVHYVDDYYYMFYSGDNCCGEHANYALMVARSRDALGPYTTLAQAEEESTNSAILESNDLWKAPGHNSLITDKQGDLWTYYHAIDVEASEKGRVMLLDKVNFEGGWPNIETGTPSTFPTKAPMTN